MHGSLRQVKTHDRGGDEMPLTLVLPLLPGQEEAWRRLVQELHGSRRADFAEARRRWGVYALALWLVSARPADLVVAQLVLAAGHVDAGDMARFARSQQPFDVWLRERVRALHGVDLSLGVARYRATLLGLWP